MAKTNKVLCSNCGQEVKEQKIKLIVNIKGIEEIVSILKEYDIPEECGKRLYKSVGNNIKEIEQ